MILRKSPSLSWFHMSRTDSRFGGKGRGLEKFSFFARFAAQSGIPNKCSSKSCKWNRNKVLTNLVMWSLIDWKYIPRQKVNSTTKIETCSRPFIISALQKTSEMIFSVQRDKSKYFYLHCNLMNHTNEQALIQYRASGNFKIQKLTETTSSYASKRPGARHPARPGRALASWAWKGSSCSTTSDPGGQRPRRR